MQLLLDTDAPYRVEIRKNNDGFYFWTIDYTDELGTFHSVMSECNHEAECAAQKCAGECLSALTIGLKTYQQIGFIVH
jgi:hypothetical protein